MSAWWMGIALVVAVLALAGLALWRAWRAPRTAAGPLRYAGLGSETVAAPPPSQAAGFDARFPGFEPHPRVPEDFDIRAFLRVAKENFIRLQVASDNGRFDEVREVTTSEMFDALSGGGGAARQTGVVTLQADLLEVATEAGRHRASVRFSGLRRKAAGAEPAGFEEVWNLVKPVQGDSGWLLAGIQQMH